MTAVFRSDALGGRDESPDGQRECRIPVVNQGHQGHQGPSTLTVLLEPRSNRCRAAGPQRKNDDENDDEPARDEPEDHESG